MRKSIGILTLGLCLLSSFSSCAKKEEATTVDTTAIAPADNTASAIETVASDKEKLRQTIILANSKGTLDDAIMEAAQDSAVRDVLRAALAAAGGNARTAANTSGSSKKSTSSATSKTTAQKKDAIDNANDAIDKTTRTIDRTTQTVDKATEAARKADELLNRTRR